MKVRYNRGALFDLNEILNYIAERNPAAAAGQLAKFEAAARLIGRNPEIGQLTLREGLRRIVVGRYLMVYEIGAAEITIHYVRHGARQRPWENETP
jgi:plasmid stabilization system protein ParE